MAVLRAKQKEVETIEAQLAKMLDELKARTFMSLTIFLTYTAHI